MHYYNKVLLGSGGGGGEYVWPESEIKKMRSFRILMCRPCPCTSVFNLSLYEPLYIWQWRSVTFLSSMHVGLYGFKNFIEDNVFAFL